MTPKEIAALYGLPPNTNGDKLLGRLVRTCPGGAEVLEAKEWAMGMLHRIRGTRAPQSEGILRDALSKILEIERALLQELEAQKSLPPGTLTDYQKTGGYYPPQKK